jgi:hypothetical protein
VPEILDASYIVFDAIAHGDRRGMMDCGDYVPVTSSDVLESFAYGLEVNPGWKMVVYYGSILLVSELVKDKDFPVMMIAMPTPVDMEGTDANALVAQYTGQ